MDDSRKTPELPRWDEVPEPQLVEVEVTVPTEAPVPVDPELVNLVWTGRKGPNLPN
jgi:hypothetical protein